MGYLSSQMSIIVVSCDAYLDIVEQYIAFLNKNWPDCCYRIIVAMEEISFIDPSVQVISCGKNSTWTERAIKAIESSNTDYILLSVDDLFISEPVDSVDINTVLSFIEKEKILYYRIPVFRITNKKVPRFKEENHVELIPKNKRYNISIGTSIWDRHELLSILGDGSMTAWDLENFFLKEAEKAEPGFFTNYVSDDRFLLHSVHMIKSGKWIPASIKKMRRLGYSINTAERGYISLMDRIKLNRFYSWCSRSIPTCIRNPIKRIMRKLGFRFASN